MADTYSKQQLQTILRATPSTWLLTAEGNGATISTVRPAETGRRHYITGAFTSYSAVSSGSLRFIWSGATKFIMRTTTSELNPRLQLNFARPIAVDAGATFAAFLSPGGGGATGDLNVTGFTI